MKTLSVGQPWSWALIFGPKRIENRAWRTRYRGPLAIHSSSNREFSKAWLETRAKWHELMPGLPEPAELVYGTVIGIVDLVDIVRLEDVRDDPFAEGPWCWITSNPRAIEPIRAAGMPGLFEVSLEA